MDRAGILAAPREKEDTFNRHKQDGDRKYGGQYVVHGGGLGKRQKTLSAFVQSQDREGDMDEEVDIFQYLPQENPSHSIVLEQIAQPVQKQKKSG